MKLPKNLLWLALVILSLPGITCAGELVDFMYKKKHYEGSKDRQYTLFVPGAYDRSEALPLVVVLHGCNQTHRDIMHDTRFNDLAESEKFFVVYPYITSYDGLRGTNCWGFWFKDEITEGKGEVADIAGIIEEIKNGYSIDPLSIHITGLSSGGAMTTAVMVAYSEIIASGAPAAGLAYGETECSVEGVCFNFDPLDPSTWYYWYSPQFESTEETVGDMISEMGASKRAVPVLVLHSENDLKVDITAARNNAAAWAALSGIDLATPISSENGETEGVEWQYTRYGSNNGKSVIETHFSHGPRHAWVGGASGTYADPDGPDWSVIAWNFFKTHRMLPGQ